MPTKIKYFLLALTFCFCCFISFGQGKIDSLLSVLKTLKEDSSVLITLNVLSEQLWRVGDYTKSKKYANDASYLSQKKLLSSNVHERLVYSKGKANAYNNIAIIYRYLGNYPEALKNHFAALKIREEIGDKKGIARSYLGIGTIYNLQGNYSEALKNELTSNKTYKEIGDKWGIANSYNHIGIIYAKQNNYNEALKNQFASMKIWKELGNKLGISEAYNSIGLIYGEQGNFLEALKNHSSCLKLKKEINAKDGITASYINIGFMNTKLKHFTEAKSYFYDALMLSKELGSKEHLKNIYNGLSVLDSTTGNTIASYKNYKMFIIYRDSLVNQKSTEQITQMQLQYEEGKKEEIRKLEEEKKLSEHNAEVKQQKIITFSIVGILVMVAIFSILLFKRFKTSQEQKKIIEEKQKEILDSIHYAKRIQTALITSEKYIDKNINKLTNKD